MSPILLFFRFAVFALLLIAVVAIGVRAQSSAFTYQGKLSDNSAPANGSYDMQFRLLDSLGNQVGVIYDAAGVTVVNGIFTVRVTFGILAFDGNPRFLEIGVKPAGSANPYTVLAPPQSVLSAPYAVRSLFSGTADLSVNSSQLGGIDADQYVLTGDTRLSDSRDPLPNSGNYIQNTNSTQASSNFNISGAGRANSFVSTQGYFISTNRVLGINGTTNLFAGVSSGLNTTGTGNSFFGGSSGLNNTTGINNAFFGFNAGSANNGGGANTFVGANAGIANVGSSNNTFLGANAGNTSLTGSGNTYLGANSDGGFLITNSVAIGQKAYVGQSNALVLGSINGLNGATANTDVGIGTSTPQARFHVVGTSLLFGDVGIGTTTPQARLNIVDNNPLPLIIESSWTGNSGLQFVNTGAGGPYRWNITAGSTLSFRDLTFSSGDLLRLAPTGGNGNGTAFVDGDLAVSSHVSIGQMSNGGNTNVCWSSGTGSLSTCSSSIRYKKEIEPFAGGMTLLNRLNPVTFRWKSDNSEDVGFIAEDVADVEPRLATYNEKGEVEGLKYDRLSTVLVNAVKEQQKQIEEQQKQIEELKTIVCSIQPQAAVCGR